MLYDYKMEKTHAEPALQVWRSFKTIGYTADFYIFYNAITIDNVEFSSTIGEVCDKKVHR
jgi:hypothetical protein